LTAPSTSQLPRFDRALKDRPVARYHVERKVFLEILDEIDPRLLIMAGLGHHGVGKGCAHGKAFRR
jgi:hypothetical protein